MKTNAVRLLEEMGVAHELRAYEVDPDDLTAETVANKIGLPAEQVFKTLVARGDRHGACFAVVSLSAGTRGLQILLTPADYVRATGARLGPIATSE